MTASVYSPWDHSKPFKSPSPLLVIGTSAVVQPAASLPAVAQQNGARIVEVNIERAFPGADFVVEEKAGAGLSKILEAVKKHLG